MRKPRFRYTRAGWFEVVRWMDGYLNIRGEDITPFLTQSSMQTQTCLLGPHASLEAAYARRLVR